MSLFDQSLSTLTPVKHVSAWRSPSNIAFVKYWGKKGHQIPANPSLSMTLKECYTQTKTFFEPADRLRVELTLSGKSEEKFAKKIETYLQGLTFEMPWLNKTALKIETQNTFPHGAGIASSASGLSALGLCLTDYIHHMTGHGQDSLFFQRASHLSRLASGSACRSIYGGFTTWGQTDLPGTSDEYATPFEVHPELHGLQDTVLVISDKEKNVSSRAGHERMKEHAYAEARFVEAHRNFNDTVSAMKSGDFERVGLILENEALQLHAMMMTSPESFTLLRPNTLAAIEMIRDFRSQTKLPLYFTLDAGPNLHLIYPDAAKNKIQAFINTELKALCMEMIFDQRGEGPLSCL
jgi:diphosphomevalonate decarboxylase